MFSTREYLRRPEPREEPGNRRVSGSTDLLMARARGVEAGTPEHGWSLERTRHAYERAKTLREGLDPDLVASVAETLRERGTLFPGVAKVVLALLREECEERLRLSVERFGPTVLSGKSDHVKVDFGEDGTPAVSVGFSEGQAGRALMRLREAVEKFFVDQGPAEGGEDFFLLAGEWLWVHLHLWAAERLEKDLGEDAVAKMDEEELARSMAPFMPDDPSVYLTDEGQEPLRLLLRELAHDYVHGLGISEMGLRDIEVLLGLEADRHYDEVAPKPRRQDDHLAVLSPLTYQQLREAIVRGDSFELVEGSPWPVAGLGKGKTRGQAILRPPAADEQEHMPPEAIEAWAKEMWRQRGELSDLDADALDALSAIWLWQARDPKDGAVVGVDDLLEMRGMKKKRGGGDGRRGGYEPEQRTDMLKALHHIQNIWIEMAGIEVEEEAGGRRGRKKAAKKAVQSRAFVITDRMGQMRLDGRMEVERFRFVPGEIFARFLLGPWRQVALLSAEALRYDPYRQTWEKRLARYLSWQWRTRARSGNYLQPYRVETLLDRAGEKLNARRPSQTKERLEKALDRLERDGVIAGWQYADFDEWWEKVVSRRKGWAPIWLAATIVIEPPDPIKEGYGRGVEIPDSLAKDRSLPPGEAFSGADIRRRRKELNLSQLQAAEQLGTTQGNLSRLERGTTKPSGELKKRIEGWLTKEPR
jgi:DNA-binding XRE family transcriptional regulator